MNKVSQRSFDELGYRTIIHDILSFHLKEVVFSNRKEISNLDPFCLFGFFRRDRFRHIWYLYPSLKLQNGRGRIYVDWKRLEYLDLFYWGGEMINKCLIEEGKRMVHLKSISLCEKYTKISELLDSTSENLFPSLVALTCVYFENNPGNKWHEFDHPFSSLACLKIKKARKGRRFGVGSFTNSKFFSRHHENFSNNLIKLELWSVVLESPLEITLPKLRDVVLFSVSNLHISTGENLMHASFSGMITSKIPIRRVVERAKNLLSLSIASTNGFTDYDKSWFMNEEFSPLPKLRILEVLHCENNGVLDHILEEKLRFVFPLLGQLKMVRSEIVGNGMFSSRSDRRKKIVLRDCHKFVIDFNSFHPSYAQTIISMELVAIGSVDFRIFSEYCWKEMRHLKFKAWGGNYHLNKIKRPINVSKWKSFPNLRTLSFDELEIEDDFFRIQEFKKLEILSIIENVGLKGENWNPTRCSEKFKNLKILRMEKCKSLTDDFFREISFF